jgi:KDO2-lipid IV(A) lauroyltransferase
MYMFMKALCRFTSRFSADALMRFGNALTFLLFDILRFRRGLLLKNLDIAFGSTRTHGDKVHLARESVRSFIWTILELLAAERYPLTAQIRAEGEEHILRALEEKKGLYLLCMHMGNWEAMAAKITQTYAPSCAVMKKVGSAGMTRFVEEYRANYGLKWIKREGKGDGFKGIREALSKGQIYGFIYDQARPGEPRLPFFSQAAKTNTSLAAIWRRVRAPIVPCYLYRTGFAQHVLVIKPALDMTVTKDISGDIIRQSTEFNQILEACIRERPEQYFWFHNRWK